MSSTAPNYFTLLLWKITKMDTEPSFTLLLWRRWREATDEVPWSHSQTEVNEEPPPIPGNICGKISLQTCF